MKKLFLFVLLWFSIFSYSFSQDTDEVAQVVLPIYVYVGDQAEIRYTFRSAVDFFSGKDSVDHIQIQNPYQGLEDKFSVIKSELYRDGMEYTLRIVIVPWTVGTINFPSFNLNDVIESNDTAVPEQSSELSEKALFSVSLFPISVKSIIEKTGQNQIMPPVPPLFLPGTTYIIFFVLVCSLVFLIFFFRFLFNFNSFRQKWKMYLKRRAFKKNAEDTIKKIKKLLKSTKLTDIEFCSALQSVTRNYLEFRFDYRFTAVSSSGIKKAFVEICANDIPNVIALSVEDIVTMFVRTDYIRYAHDSIDSQLYPPAEHQAALLKHERKSLTELVLKAIECFEKDQEQLEEENVY